MDINNQFENCNILIIGGAGFVGSNLTKLIFSSNQKVKISVVDNLLSSERFNLPDDKRLTFICGSITNDNILKQLKNSFDYVFHLATYHGNQSSIHDPLADHENNTFTTLRLFEHIKSFNKIKKVVYSSAGCSVAKKTFDAAEETLEDAPIEIKQDSPYSISKIIGEFYSVYYHKQHNLPTVRARFQNVYGPGEVLGAGQWRGTPATIWRNVTPVFIYKALNNLPLPIENEGIATRDFIFVEDICRGLISCAIKGKHGEVYNIGSGNETSILQLATMINNLTGNEAGFDYLQRRPWDNSGKRFASIKKSEQELGFKAGISIEQGLRITIEWTRKNLDIINKCIEKHKAHLIK
jgi:nucleoside-diphosphate-sugar epimerase